MQRQHWKVAPLKARLSEIASWLTNLERDDSSERKDWGVNVENRRKRMYFEHKPGPRLFIALNLILGRYPGLDHEYSLKRGQPFLVPHQQHVSG